LQLLADAPLLTSLDVARVLGQCYNQRASNGDARGDARSRLNIRRILDMAQYAFFKGNYVPLAEAKVGILTHAFNYGTGVFEGIRAYWNEEQKQLYVWKMREHYQRLHNSCRILSIGLRYSVDDLCNITLEVLRRSEARADIYLRPIAYKSGEVIGVRLHNIEDDFTLACVPFGKYVEAESAHCRVSTWRRMDDSVAPVRAKITGIYVNSALAKTEVVLDGYDEAILLNADGHVSEGSGENIFIVRDGVLITPDVSENILEGITRDFVMQLAREDVGMKVEERVIDRSELYIADECFMTGTAAEITVIGKIDRRVIGSGQLGPYTAKLRAAFESAVRGKTAKYASACTPVWPK
jgi:branched-chain amino acid aminotransferase